MPSPDMPTQVLVDHYFVPRAKEIYRMEYYWGMRRGEIEYEGDLNRLTLSAGLKKLLEDEQYALIPDDDTLRVLYDIHDTNQECSPAERRVLTEVLPRREYTYELRATSSSSPKIPCSDSTIRSYVHPALVIGATYHIFNCFPLLDRTSWISSIASFYLLQLPKCARSHPDWCPGTETATAWPDHGGSGSPTRRQRARRSLESRPSLDSDITVSESDSLPLLVGLPESLPLEQRSLSPSSSGDVDLTLVLVNDDDIGDYASEPVRPVLDTVEHGDDWKDIFKKRVVAQKRVGVPKQMRVSVPKQTRVKPAPRWISFTRSK